MTFAKVTPYLLLGSLFSWALVFTIQSCTPENSAEQPTLGKNTSQLSWEANQFVGDQSCKSCHEKEYADWQGSHHAKAMMEASDSTVLGDFNNVEIYSKGIKSRFFKRDGKFFVETPVTVSHSEEFEIKYTFGVEPLQQYLVEFPGGRLQALHLSWDTDLQKWFEQYPNDTFPSWDWLHWSKGAMTWNSMCADCHSTNLEKNFSQQTNEYQTTWSILNVSCEACHGPGQAHIELVNSTEYDPANAVPGSYLKQTSGITPIEQVEQCAPCHSRRMAISEKYDMSGRFDDHYIHEILKDGIYHPDGQIDEEVYVYGSFIQSKMFQNGVKCSSCHNVHSGELLIVGNGLCLQCHSPAQFDTPEHHFHPIKTESAECVSCHMPGKFFMGNDFRRDHSFRVPRPDLSLRFDTPNACNGCHEDQTTEWASSTINEWYGPDRKSHFSDYLVAGYADPQALIELVNNISEPAIARATAIFQLRDVPDDDAYQTIVKSLKDRSARVRVEAAIALMELPAEDRIRLGSPLLGDPIRSVRISAADLLADQSLQAIPLAYQEAFKIATDEYRKSLDQTADFATGQLRIAQYHERNEEYPQAVAAYLKAITIDSLEHTSRFNLSRIYSVQGKNALAIKTLTDLIKLEPNNWEAFYYLALVQVEENLPDDAISNFKTATRLNPTNTRIYYNLGLLLQKTGKGDEAERVFNAGLAQNSEADDLRYALATIYVNNGKFEEARKEAEILAARYPDNGDIQQLLNTIRLSLLN